MCAPYSHTPIQKKKKHVSPNTPFIALSLKAYYWLSHCCCVRLVRMLKQAEQLFLLFDISLHKLNWERRRKYFNTADLQGLDNETETLANVEGFTSICLAANLQSEARVDQ